jgi:hypothetical protein
MSRVVFGARIVGCGKDAEHDACLWHVFEDAATGGEAPAKRGGACGGGR